MAASHMEGKKLRAGAIELYPGGSRGPVSGPQGDIDSHHRDFNSSSSAGHISIEGGNTYRGGSFSYERNRSGNGSAKDVLKGGVHGVVEGLASNAVNQNGGLYIGGGKMGGLTSGPPGPTTTGMSSGRADTVEWSSPVVHVRSNSAGSIKTAKYLGSPFWASGNGNAFEGSVKGGRTAGGNVETMSSSGSSNGGSPAQDLGKGSKAHFEGNKVRGIGNIGGRGGNTNPKSPPSSQSTGKGGLSTPMNSGEFSILYNGNNSNQTPRHPGEFSVGSNGPASSSSTSSPCTSGELGSSAKFSTTSHAKSSPDSCNNSKGGPISTEGNIGSGRTPSGLNVPKAGKPNSGSPPRSSSAGISNFGNLCKANWNAEHTKTNEKIDSSMRNILNPNHVPPCTNGNILSSGKGLARSEAPKNGVDMAKTRNGDLVSESAMMKRGLCSINSEEVKNIGNEFYRKGNFTEALSFYVRAVSLSPGKASYRSNKAAALSGLGRLAEAVHECEEAIKLDAFHARAHHRAGSLYLRLGLVESSKRHFQSAGQQSSLEELQSVEQVKKYISKCIEMRKAANWKAVLRESDAAVVAGADSAPQVFGYKAEALLKLHRPEDADIILSTAQKTEEALTKLGIIPADSFLHVIRAHLDMTLGRFEEAVAAAQAAVRVDPRKAEAMDILRRARAVCLTRSSGNELFKMGKFFEACAAYGEGLESDPRNAVLLCNRAACRSKLGQWEKAVEDCNAALGVQPNYTKALMRRADCNVKLERWEDALNDYECLLKEIPGDTDVARGVLEAQTALKRSTVEDMRKMKFGNGMEEVSTKDQFREAVTFPG